MADAPKILGSDSLRLAYPKLNMIIDMVNDFKAQIATLVIEGDSSVEAAHARVRTVGAVTETFTTLKDRLDDTDTAIAAKSDSIEVSNIADRLENVDLKSDLPRLNSLYLSNFYKKMQNADTAPIGNDVSIAFQGDSMTAGNGATAGNDFPTQLKNYLSSISRDGQTITVINRGIGGNTASDSLNVWKTPSGADVCVIFLGTNDFNKNSSMESFSISYEAIVRQEIEGGTGVILVTPHKWRKADWLSKANNGSLADFSVVIKDFGKKYNAPVLDLLQETRNIDINAYASEADPGIHFNDTGYKLLAHKLGAMLGFQHPHTLPKVGNNSFINVRPSIDGVKVPSTYSYLHHSSSYPGPIEFIENEGTGFMAGATEETLHFAFYAKEDNLCIIPSFWFSATDGSEKFELTINGGGTIPIHPNNRYQYSQTLDRSLPPASLSLKMTNYPAGHAKTTTTQNFFAKPNSFFFRYLPTAGWYTVKLVIKNCRFHGFDFINQNQMNIYRQMYILHPEILT